MTRVSVPLRYAYRLLNHGPTTLVTTRAGDRTNIMSAQWVMPLDFDPPVLAIVVESTSYTRRLLDESGDLALSIPVRDQAQLAWHAGSCSGADVDKLAGVRTFAGEIVAAPLVEGCLGWLECRIVRGSAYDALAAERDLFVATVVAASADARAWRDDRIVLDELRTLHHLGGGAFVVAGDLVSGRR